MQWKLDSTLRLNEAIGNRFKTQSLFQHTPHVLHAPSKGYKAKLPAPSTGAGSLKLARMGAINF